MSETPSLSLPLLAAEQAQKHVTMNEALGLLDAAVHLSVKDRDLAVPPASPAEGDRYIVAAGATGAWAGKSGQIALRLNGGWVFRPPREGWRCWAEDEDLLLTFDGTAWQEFAAAPSELQNLSLLGVGTTADATNPFSAKLNKALWTAKTAAEGGDGDLRYTMNKEAAADVLSLLLQTGFSGRAEIGLIGNDDLAVKVSADGSSWTTALVVDKSTGTVLVPAGTAGAPGLKVGDSDTGLYQTSGRLHAALDGAEVLRFSGTFVALGSGYDPVDAIHVRRTGGAGARISLEGENAVNNQVHRFSNNNAGANFVMRKSRGSIAAPAAPIQNDQLGNIFFEAGTDPGSGGRIRVEATAAVPSAAAKDARLTIALGTGSTSLGEVLGLDHASGLSMFGANPVIDQNRHHRLRSYTNATLPAASAAAGQMIYCSDLGGGGGQLVSDGTSWRRASRSGQQTVSSDAAFTLTTLISAEEQKHTGTLTANRLVTLSATNAYAGSRFRITRTGGGAFNLEIGGLKNLATNTWCEVVHDGSAWYLAAYGAL